MSCPLFGGIHCIQVSVNGASTVDTCETTSFVGLEAGLGS